MSLTIRILWIKKVPPINGFTLPKDFKVSKDLKNDVQKDEYEEAVLEGYAALACVLQQNGFKIRFMEKGIFIKELETMNTAALKNLDLIVYGNWPYKCNNLAETYQNLENLSVMELKFSLLLVMFFLLPINTGKTIIFCLIINKISLLVKKKPTSNNTDSYVQFHCN